MTVGLCFKVRFFVAVGVVAIAFGCNKPPSGKKPSKQKTPPEESTLELFNENPFKDNDNLSAAIEESLKQIKVNANAFQGLTEENLWALANCECSEKFANAYFPRIANAPGVLPQPLVPSIRKEITKNPLLQLLLRLPDGFLSDAASILIKILMKDEKVSEKVREGLTKKMNNALGGGTNLKNNFRFDLYSSPYLLPGYKDSEPKSFRIGEQASKWAYIFSVPNMWEGKPSLGFTDHGIQLLNSAKSLSEWSYAFGLDEPIAGKVYGGLAFEPNEGLNGRLGQFNPRLPGVQPRILSGTYSISYPISGVLDLAINVEEHWQRLAERVSLDEQARLWTSAAKAYSRLKPSARNAATNSLFDFNKGMFPPDVHQLALAFLPGMGALLKGPFVNSNTKFIHQYAAIPNTPIEAIDTPASLRSLSRLTLALNTWLMQTESMLQDQLSQSTYETVKSSEASLKDAMRLAIRNIIGQHVDEHAPFSKLGGVALVTSAQSPSAPTMEEAAEVLATMTMAEQTILKTQTTPDQRLDWQRKIVGLYHWFASEYLAPLAAGNSTPIKPEAAIWTYIALKNFSGYDESQHKAPWLDDAIENLEQAFTNWNEQVGK